MKRLVRLLGVILLGATLCFAPVALAADPVAHIPSMVQANYIFQADNTLCSATLISTAERWAMTNYHCIAGAVRVMDREEVQADGTVRSVKRVFYDEITLAQPAYSAKGTVGALALRAEVLGFSKEKDLAVLRILSETTPLPKSALIPPDSYKLVQGQSVYAVGNPVGLENTVSKGTLNHLYREHRWGPDQIARYIQTDAAIEGGSSGGALYSEEGYLIGVPSAGYRGAALKFAIPFDVYKSFLSDNGFARAWDSSAPSRDEFLATQKAKAKEDRK